MKSELMQVDELAASQGEAMITLYQRHFEGVSREQFHQDLDEKAWVILLESEGQLHGFSTFDIYDVEHRGETVSVVCSGETVVDAPARGSTALPSTWIGAVNHLRRELGKNRMWWLLVVSGYRTYRFLPVFWQRFWPRTGETAPPEMQELLEALAVERFDEGFDRETGIVRPETPEILRPRLRGIPEWRLRGSNVAFFAERNPGHEKGDGLVCLTELSHDNLTAAGCRMWDAGERMFATRRAKS